MSELIKEQNILRQLVKSREAIRRKYNILKQNKAYIAKSVGETLKPLIDPLGKLVSLTEKNNIRDATRVEDVNLKSPKIEQSKNELLSEKHDNGEESSIDSENEASTTIVENESFLDKYFEMMNPNSNKYKDFDKVYGVYKKNSKLFFGNSEIEFKNDNIIVKNQEYPNTSGLMELLFKREPNQNLTNKEDLKYYRQISNLTNAHRKQFDENNDLRHHKSRKFETIILPLYKSGGGFLPK